MDKISPRLAAALTGNHSTADARQIDVVVELTRLPVPQASEIGPRLPRDIMREQFSQAVVAVRAVTQAAGGEVSAEAWINQTVRAKVPASCIHELARLDEVRLVDLPSDITPE